MTTASADLDRVFSIELARARAGLLRSKVDAAGLRARWRYFTPLVGDARRGLELARAEQYLQREGWWGQEEPDPEAAQEEGAPRWVLSLYDPDGEPLVALGAVDFGEEHPHGLDERGQPFARLAYAELAEEALGLAAERLDALRIALGEAQENLEPVTEPEFAAHAALSEWVERLGDEALALREARWPS